MKTVLIILFLIIVLSKKKKKTGQQTQQTQQSSQPRPQQGQQGHEPPPEAPPEYDLCKKCGALVKKTDFRCPTCGKLQKSSSTSLWIAVIIFALLTLYFLHSYGYIDWPVFQQLGIR